jgi:hypothetical protein
MESPKRKSRGDGLASVAAWTALSPKIATARRRARLRVRPRKERDVFIKRGGNEYDIV